MPNNQGSDFYLDGKPYMLLRTQGQRGRAWVRTGAPDKAGIRMNLDESKFGGLPDELAFAEVWDDWSGGGGFSQRRPGNTNAYHWAHGIDGRFPGVLMHAQQLQDVSQDNSGDARGIRASLHDVHHMMDIPTPRDRPPPGNHAVLFVGKRVKAKLFPTRLGQSQNFILNDQITATGGDFTGKPALFGSFIAIGLASISYGQWWIEPLDGTAGTYAAAGGPVGGFVNAGNRLWRWFGPVGHPNFVQVMAAGASMTPTANWAPSGGYLIGNGHDGINDMIQFEDNLYAGMPEGLFQGDVTGTFWNVTPDLGGMAHQDNLRTLTVHQGQIVFNHVSGIYAYEPSNTTARIRNIGPPLVDIKSEVHGRFRAVTGYGQWLFAGLDTGSFAYVLVGRDASYPLPYVWHHMSKITYNQRGKISRIHVDGVTAASGGEAIPQRLWVAMDASYPAGGTAPLYCMPFPANFSNALGISAGWTANFTASTHLALGQVDRMAPGIDKLWERVEVWSDKMLEDYRYAYVYYELDSEGTQHALGRVATSPVEYLGFPPNTVGRAMELFYDTTAKPDEPFIGPQIDELFAVRQSPETHAIVLRGISRPPVRGLIEAQVRIADNLNDRQKIRMRPGARMLEDLRALADPAVTPGAIPLIDLAGARSCVVVLPPLVETEYYQDLDAAPEIQVSLRLAVVACSGYLWPEDIVPDVPPPPPPDPPPTPILSDRMYVHTNHGLWKRASTGVWGRTSYPISSAQGNVQGIVGAPNSTTRLYAIWENVVAGTYAFWRTDNGGASWTAITVPTNVNPIYIASMSVAEDDEDEIWIAVNNGGQLSPRADGIWHSFDAGATWALVHQVPNEVYDSYTNGVYSSDTGADKRLWYSSRMSAAGDSLDVTLNRMHWDDGPGGSGSIKGPQGYSQSWNRRIIGVRGNSDIAYALGPFQYGDGLIGIEPALGAAGHWVSGGWLTKGEPVVYDDIGETSTATAAIWTIEMRADGIGLAWGASNRYYYKWGIWKTADFGYTWALVYSADDLPGTQYAWHDWAHSIAQDPDIPGSWWAVVNDTTGNNVWALFSFDDGATWSRELITNESPAVRPFGIWIAG